MEQLYSRSTRGLVGVFTNVYPQLNDVDLRTQASELDVPVYIIKGRWDVNAVNSLTEEYFALLDAPHKELIWFEDSAHTPLWDAPEHFTEVLVTNVLADTYPQMADGQKQQ
jgi:pimeloyl-ACP methyl ester carboxylesterase